MTKHFFLAPFGWIRFSGKILFGEFFETMGVLVDKEQEFVDGLVHKGNWLMGIGCGPVFTIRQ